MSSSGLNRPHYVLFRGKADLEIQLFWGTVIKVFRPLQFHMKFLALEVWAAAHADYNAAAPSFRHAKLVPDLFNALSGIRRSVSYVLMTILSFKDKSYSISINCLCLNIS